MDPSSVVIPPTPTPEGYELRAEVLIPARQARAVRVRRGEVVQLIDVRGQQVGDLMAWLLDRPDECLSPAHTISCLTHLVPREGEALYTNHRREVFRIRRDTVGRHDLIVPCCDPERYERDFGLSDHPSCLRSIARALEEASEDWHPRGELAWNVFMNNVLTEEGAIVTQAPPHGPGDHIELECMEDLGVVVSACPQDLTVCNAFNPTEMALRIFQPTP